MFEFLKKQREKQAETRKAQADELRDLVWRVAREGDADAKTGARLLELAAGAGIDGDGLAALLADLRSFEQATAVSGDADARAAARQQAAKTLDLFDVETAKALRELEASRAKERAPFATASVDAQASHVNALRAREQAQRIRQARAKWFDEAPADGDGEQADAPTNGVHLCWGYQVDTLRPRARFAIATVEALIFNGPTAARKLLDTTTPVVVDRQDEGDFRDLLEIVSTIARHDNCGFIWRRKDKLPPVESLSTRGRAFIVDDVISSVDGLNPDSWTFIPRPGQSRAELNKLVSELRADFEAKKSKEDPFRESRLAARLAYSS